MKLKKIDECVVQNFGFCFTSIQNKLLVRVEVVDMKNFQLCLFLSMRREEIRESDCLLCLFPSF